MARRTISGMLARIASVTTAYEKIRCVSACDKRQYLIHAYNASPERFVSQYETSHFPKVQEVYKERWVKPFQEVKRLLKRIVKGEKRNCFYSDVKMTSKQYKILQSVYSRHLSVKGYVVISAQTADTYWEEGIYTLRLMKFKLK